ncbi:type VI secretion system contractile sheath small subunit [Marinibactrum halimedae]|uniref:Type VI secretion system-associated protein n=1 Tax=Marinibactrum halimedae TaxID=1444977 RepID=A0AA37WMG2_9GAMM|nr:type VI secretion system contractile sheath small subunit [Marinibactrum halimedae]MCD9458107.1 type VI secretion system contractile sheath small subunit [Marinibactrum halimedae]GLS25041.1 type VI secretion system-associated protein [Marinibactrum halimedae]
MAIQDTIPKSRMTLRYKTEVNGQPEDVELPLRLLIMGDFSGKSSSKVPFSERKVINFDGDNINAVLEKMKIKVNVKDDDENIHSVPIDNVDSFLPHQVCKNISSLNDLVRSKKSLNTLLSSLNNSAKFREALKGLIAKPEAVEALKNILTPGYQSSCLMPIEIMNKKIDSE